ncbi:MAG TPA: ABC transporter substrate-binding protein [Solirubrobacteraceae bacterium]|nr:ABC transporter substrate-binding protein [Solirubrobacteraceae bacterium]
MRVSRSLIASLAVTGLLGVGITACGSSNSKSSSGGGSSSQSSSNGGVPTIPLKAGENPTGQVLTGSTKKRGGSLTVYSSEDFEHLDPGESYFTQDYGVDYVTQRSLFAYMPNTADQVSPDLATTLPTTANGGITDGGKTVTVHIRQGVHFSPPVNREVTSADVAYAIERGANPNVANPYFGAYFGANAPAPLVGAESPNYKGGPIPGIQTPNKFTIVFHTTKPSGSFLVSALSLPITMPVPESFAGPLDKKSPTTYGSKFLVATGPYMIKSDLKTGLFQGIGYQTGKSLNLVRNPNWSAKTDFRPAYLNQINFSIGGDATVIGRQVLQGSNAVQFDTPAQSIVKLAYQQYPSQITFTPGSGDHYVALDNAAGVFKDVNLRRAVWANLNRAAIVKQRGGSLSAEPATHFIYPGVSGYDQSGGAAGPQVPWNKSVNGSLSVAETYMKAAGFKSGKYTGSAKVQIVSSTNGDDPAIAQILNSDMTQLGFHTHVSLVDQSVMYAKYCGVPKQEIDACPAVGWVRDFADPLTVLYVPFYGPAIVPTNNSNWGQVNDPQINTAMQKAALVTDPTARAQAWANIDKMLVNQAVAIPEDFDNQPNVESKDVAGVDELWNTGTWDLDFTSLKNP